MGIEIYTDEGMKRYLTGLGYIIENETDLIEIAMIEGFKWNDYKMIWER